VEDTPPRTGELTDPYTRSAGLKRRVDVENKCMEPIMHNDIDLTDPDVMSNPDVDLVMMDLLRAHVPLSLLIDLCDPQGPNSTEILAAEAG
jgi:hypothetical protein